MFCLFIHNTDLLRPFTVARSVSGLYGIVLRCGVNQVNGFQPAVLLLSSSVTWCCWCWLLYVCCWVDGVGSTSLVKVIGKTWRNTLSIMLSALHTTVSAKQTLATTIINLIIPLTITRHNAMIQFESTLLKRDKLKN